MILNSTQKIVDVVLLEDVGTVQLDVTAQYHDIAIGAGGAITSFIPGSSDVATTGTVAATVVTAPAVSVARQVKRIIVMNVDTAEHTIKLRLTNQLTGNSRVFAQEIVPPGGSLQYTG